MSNIISFLVITAASLIGLRGDYAPNQLLNFGLLVVIAYLLSRMMCFLRLPAVIGYILAGILAGHNGLGLLHEMSVSNMALVEGLCVMIILSDAVRFMFEGASLNGFSKYFLSGMISSIGTLILTIVLLLPFSIPIQMKIALGLFAATFSPLICFSYIEHDDLYPSGAQIAFGGFICAILLWGFMAPLWDQIYPSRIKLAFMPFVISITSILTGFVWVFLFEKLFSQESRSLKHFFPLATMFLIYPLCMEIGLDYLFVAIGAGIYNGLVSEWAKDSSKPAELSVLIVFSFFGTQLSLGEALLLGSTGWGIAALISAGIVFSKIATIKLSTNILFPQPRQHISTVCFIPYGPLALIALRRFLPGFGAGVNGEFDKFSIFSLCTIIIILTIIVSVFYLVLREQWLKGTRSS
ncbi:MAG: hypothetical protein HOC71_09570 [Candidatus Latescibacteria bacterium]|jgi:hypothetical protein|nr:hypothetical protein [Candidatus Latescibacterota bacterium]